MAISSISELNNVAGSNTEIQYNNSGVFGASSNLTFDGTDLAVGNAAPSSYIDSVHGLIVGDTGDATSEIVVATSTTGVGEINFTDTANTTNQCTLSFEHTTNDFKITTSSYNWFWYDEDIEQLYVRSQDTGANYVQVIQNVNAAATTQHILYMSYASTPDDNTYNFLRCLDGTADRCLIRSDGDLQNHDNSYGAISDERLKQDIVDASSQWDDIKNLRVRKYKFISDVEAYGAEAVTHIGVIAQEAELVSPGLVQHHVSDAVLNEDGSVKEPAVDEYSVQYSVLYMKCVKALQEAMARIETLEAQVAALQP